MPNRPSIHNVGCQRDGPRPRVGSRAGEIAAADAKDRLDVTGMVVAPGFIDVHTQADDVWERPQAENFVKRGVTSIVAGNCGGSADDVAAGNLWVPFTRYLFNSVFIAVVGTGVYILVASLAARVVRPLARLPSGPPQPAADRGDHQLLQAPARDRREQRALQLTGAIRRFIATGKAA